MSKIKERDILKLLDGNASSKKLKKLEEWSSSSKKNARELEQYQRIYDELNNISSYKKVKPKKEWKAFISKMNVSVTDGEILEYLDGMSSPSQRKKVENWKDLSSENQKDFEIFDLILSQSAQIKEQKSFDANTEWASFQQKLSEKESAAKLLVLENKHEKEYSIVAPTITTTTSEADTSSYTPAKEVAFVPSTNYETREESNTRWLWRSVAIAASLLLLSAFLWSIWQNDSFGFGSNSNSNDLFATIVTEEKPDVITLSDGSVLTLNEYTSLTYFTDVDRIDEREVTIEGRGEFDVASNPVKPFIVKAPLTGVGVRVLGTRFRLEESDTYVEVIENIEGSVRAYSLADTTVNVTLIAGDKYGFDGEKFINIRELEQEYVGTEYDILYVLDYLMEASDWRVTSAPYSEFDGESSVIINLEQSYEDILRDLKKQSDFEYIKLDCDGCYKVMRFKSIL